MTLSTEIDVLPPRIETERTIPLRPLPVPVISAITVAVVIGLWSLASVYALVSPVFLPSPRQVVLAIYNLAVKGFVDATLAEHVGASLYRIFGALIASVLIGIPAGIAIGVSRIGRGILDPIVEFLRPVFRVGEALRRVAAAGPPRRRTGQTDGADPSDEGNEARQQGEPVLPLERADHDG